MASGDGRELVRVGDIVRVEEADYCYGRGPLTMRVSDGEPRDVLVRFAALRDLSLEQ